MTDSLKLTPQQLTALARVWNRDNNGMGLEDFIQTAQPTFYMDDAIVVKWCNMWLAIERDGYTHS